jgi:hypothetical protein
MRLRPIAFQRQHDQGPRGVLRQRLVDLDRYRRTRTDGAVEKMGCYELLGDILRHVQTSPSKGFINDRVGRPLHFKS